MVKTKLLSAERRFVIIPEHNDNVSKKIKNNESQIIQEAWHFDARLAQGPLAIARIEIAVFGDSVEILSPRPPRLESLEPATRPVPVPLLSVAVLTCPRTKS
jgi:hypothetical protein